MMTAHDPLLSGGQSRDTRPHAIVIGAGFGGLAAAVRLGARGDRVTVFEELWALCGRRLADDVDLRPLDPFYTVRFDDGQEFHVNGDDKAMEAEIAKFSPGDVAGYRRYLAESERCFQAGFTGMIDKTY